MENAPEVQPEQVGSDSAVYEKAAEGHPSGKWWRLGVAGYLAVAVALVTGVGIGAAIWVPQVVTAQAESSDALAERDQAIEANEDSPAETAAPEPSADEPTRSERGNIVKKVGEVGEIGDSPEVEFTVTGITVDPVCTREYAQASKYGHFVKLDFDITTTKDAEGDFGLSFWKWINADGTTANADPSTGNGSACLPEAETVPRSIGPAEKVSGSVILDVPSTEGFLVLNPSYGVSTGFESWEWAVPAQ